jgi:hypothetical protein
VFSTPIKDDAQDTIKSAHNPAEEFDYVDAEAHLEVALEQEAAKQCEQMASEAHLETVSGHNAAEQLEQLEAAVIVFPKTVEAVDTVIAVKELVEQGLPTAAGPLVHLGPMAHVARSRLGSASEDLEDAGLHLDLGFMDPQAEDTWQASVHSKAHEPAVVVGAQAQRSTLGSHCSSPHAVVSGLGMVVTTANILWDPDIILSTTTSP